MTTRPKSEHRDYRWRSLLGDQSEQPTIDERLEAVHHAWESADMTMTDVHDLNFDVAVHDGIDETLNKLEEPWRTALLEQLKGCALTDPAEKPIRIFGGIYGCERERDPGKAAQMRREVEAQRATEDDYFMNVTRPRIREWWTRRKGGE
ncbi:hypothetical protein [Sorangium sp. So ce117]|uniref:hypothetical protein n=1 Tax=Sorangium sp. So ce117 TaxID=3133277 RepID=UPI003F641F54